MGGVGEVEGVVVVVTAGLFPSVDVEFGLEQELSVTARDAAATIAGRKLFVGMMSPRKRWIRQLLLFLGMIDRQIVQIRPIPYAQIDWESIDEILPNHVSINCFRG
jgi:hypothetical protein